MTREGLQEVQKILSTDPDNITFVVICTSDTYSSVGDRYIPELVVGQLMGTIDSINAERIEEPQWVKEAFERAKERGN